MARQHVELASSDGCDDQPGLSALLMADRPSIVRSDLPDVPPVPINKEEILLGSAVSMK